MAHRVSVRNQQTKSQDRVVPGGTDFRAERQAQEEKNWERQPFYLLTSALMGDPNALDPMKRWEQTAAYFLDTNKAVKSFVKNSGLGFAIPYLYNGQMHDYVPDFIIRLNA